MTIIKSSESFIKDDTLTLNYNSPSTNYLIEGDNLYSLKELIKQNIKVDIVEIDIPYHTNNKTFNTYNDSYNDDEWIKFIEKRLILIKEIMRDNSVIFIHIDDNELYRLKLLCDDIFNKNNFVSNLIWKKTYTLKNDSNKLSNQTEYILFYKKGDIKFKNLPLDEEYINKSYRYEDNRGRFRTMQLYKDKNKNSYEIISPTGKVWKKPWNYSESSMRKLLAEDRVYFGKDGNGIPSKKVYLDLNKGKGLSNFIDGSIVGYSSNGTKDLINILGEVNKFPYPKPVNLIKYIINMVEFPKDAVVLDCFAGSGTTFEAVQLLNKEMNLDYQVILCNNNENNICKEVTYQRMKKVIEGYYNKKGIYIEGTKSNLVYFKLNS